MKLRKIIGVAILLVFLLYISGTYVAYADKTASDGGERRVDGRVRG